MEAYPGIGHGIKGPEREPQSGPGNGAVRVGLRFRWPASLNDFCNRHIGRCSVTRKLLVLFCHGQLQSSFANDLFAIGPRDPLREQPIADRLAAQERCLCALAFQSFTLFSRAASSGGLTPANELVGTDFALAGKEAVLGRSLGGQEKMAEGRFTDGELKSYLADGGSGLPDGADRFCAIKIMKLRPLRLQVGDGGRGSGHK
jgi:hypothetical protein